MTRYMLDTNACIGIVNGRPPALREHLMRFAPREIAISQIVRYELEYGVCHSRHQQQNRANLLHFLRYVQVLNWSGAQTSEAAQIRCELSRAGQPIGPYDTLIAGHARSLNAILVTHNTRELKRVPGLELEDWESA